MHSVLDIVEVAPVEQFIAMGLAGQRGAVLSIRRYPDGHYRYSIGSVLDLLAVGDDEVPGIYDEEHLLPTGLRTTAGRYGPIPPFRLRDVVQISLDCDIEEARGCTGYVDSAYIAQPGVTPIGVWVVATQNGVIGDPPRSGEDPPCRRQNRRVMAP